MKTGIPFGFVTNIVGVGVLLLWIPLGQRMGVGTVLNALAIGPSAELGLLLIPRQSSFWIQIPMFVVGLVLLAVGVGMYIGARYGPGPRDGLMTGLHAKLGWPIWLARGSVEIAVLIIGWILGGDVGIGTVVAALLIGPMVNLTMPLLHIAEAPKPSAERSPGT